MLLLFFVVECVFVSCFCSYCCNSVVIVIISIYVKIGSVIAELFCCFVVFDVVDYEYDVVVFDVVDDDDDIVGFVVVLSQKTSIKSLVKIGSVIDVAFVVLVLVVVVVHISVVIVIVDPTNLPLTFELS